MNIKFWFSHSNRYSLEHKREAQTTKKSILKTNRAQSNKDKINNKHCFRGFSRNYCVYWNMETKLGRKKKKPEKGELKSDIIKSRKRNYCLM